MSEPKRRELETPDAWNMAPLSSLLEFRNGVNAEKGAYGRGVRFINVLEVITKSHLRAGEIPGRVQLDALTSASYRVRRGDLVFNRTSETQEEVGLAAVYLDDEPVVFGGFVIRGQPIERSRLDPEYAGYSLRAPFVRQQIIARGQGAIRANIGQADLRTVVVPEPPLAEQRAIAAALSDVDALIGALDRLIAKKRDLKQAAMQQLLTGQTRLPGFSGEWEERKLGSRASFRTGPFGSALHKADYTVDGVPIVNPMHIIDGRIMPTSTMTVTERAAEKLADFRLKVSDVVIGRRGDMGRCAVVLEHQTGWLCGTGSMIVRSSPDMSPAFLQRVLSSPPIIASIEESSVGTTMVNLNQKVLSGLNIAFPILDEQLAIATVLSDMDLDLAALEHRRDKTRMLKQGMMQELLTGRIRLV